MTPRECCFFRPLVAVLSLCLTACVSTQDGRLADPDFGKTVRQSLQAQTLPSAPAQAPRATFLELEPGLNRYLVNRTTDRTSTAAQAPIKSP